MHALGHILQSSSLVSLTEVDVKLNNNLIYIIDNPTNIVGVTYSHYFTDKTVTKNVFFIKTKFKKMIYLY